MRGKIYPARTMFLRVNVGNAESGGKSYNLTLTSNNNSPLVESLQTKKYFHLPWQDIIELAIESGIDKPERKKNK